MKYDITIGDKWTCPLKQYENRSPLVSITKTIESDSVDLSKEMAEMWLVVNTKIKEIERFIQQEHRINSLQHMRFYEKDGKKYPSVTSIISPEPYDGEPLYGERGDFLHSLFAENDFTHKFTQAEEERFAKIGGLTGFDLSWLSGNIDFEFEKSEIVVYNDEELYAGRYDKDGLYKGKPALFDLKSGNLNKEGLDNAFMQLSAYAHCVSDIQQLVVLPCHPKAKKLPIVTNEIDKYYAMFMQKRIEFRDKFGL